MTKLRVLVAEDFDGFKKLLTSTLKKRFSVEQIWNVQDGLAAIETAAEERPDLVLMDIGLPIVNGIEAARRILQLSPGSKILFVTSVSSREAVEEAMNLGAHGYVVKTDLAHELVVAVDAVLKGEKFVSSSLAGSLVGKEFDSPDSKFSRSSHGPVAGIPATRNRHELISFHDDNRLLDLLTTAAEKEVLSNAAVILVGTNFYKEELLVRLRRADVPVDAAADEGRFVVLDSDEVIAKFSNNGKVNREQFLQMAEGLIKTARRASKADEGRIFAMGQCVPRLWELGHIEAAVEVEQLWNEVAEGHNLDIVCCYRASAVESEQNKQAFEQICAAHSTVFL